MRYSSREKEVFQGRLGVDTVPKEKRSVLCSPASNCSRLPLVFRRTSDERQTENGDERIHAAGGETRISKKYLQGARNSHTMHPTQDIALFETGSRVKNLSKYFVSGPSILRDTDFDTETGEPSGGNSARSCARLDLQWKASIFHCELMMRVDDESVEIFYWFIWVRFNIGMILGGEMDHFLRNGGRENFYSIRYDNLSEVKVLMMQKIKY